MYFYNLEASYNTAVHLVSWEHISPCPIRGSSEPWDPYFEIQFGAPGCEKCYVNCFLKVFFACLGSTAAAVQPNDLWKSQKTFYKTSFTT